MYYTFGGELSKRRQSGISSFSVFLSFPFKKRVRGGSVDTETGRRCSKQRRASVEGFIEIGAKSASKWHLNSGRRLEAST